DEARGGYAEPVSRAGHRRADAERADPWGPLERVGHREDAEQRAQLGDELAHLGEVLERTRSMLGRVLGRELRETEGFEPRAEAVELLVDLRERLLALRVAGKEEAPGLLAAALGRPLEDLGEAPERVVSRDRDVNGHVGVQAPADLDE